MEIKTYAPVMITTLCRHEHFKRCIESLSRCTGAEYTELFIGLDYPAKESHQAGYVKICEYLNAISGFKSVHIFRREKNYGVRENIIDLRNKIKDRFDRYISTEDDNEFSPNFLDYMNKGLELYNDNPKVIAVCGYSYPFDYCRNLDNYTYNAYPMKSFCGWGTGYWIEKRNKISPFVTSSFANQLIHSWHLVFQLFRRKQHITVHRLIFRHKDGFGDLMWRAYCSLNDVYCIFPVVSKVRNWGFDGTGMNCKKSLIYEQQKIDQSTHFNFLKFEIKQYKPIARIQNKLFGGNWFIRRLCEFDYFFYRIFGISTSKLRKKVKKWKSKIQKINLSKL